jgi:hypothetical protein
MAAFEMAVCTNEARLRADKRLIRLPKPVSGRRSLEDDGQGRSLTRSGRSRAAGLRAEALGVAPRHMLVPLNERIGGRRCDKQRAHDDPRAMVRGHGGNQE